MSQPIVGIDVAKSTLAVCLLRNEKTLHREISNNIKGHRSLTRWLKKHKVSQAHVCLEATGQYGNAVAEYLYEQGHTLSIVNPALIKAFGQSKLRRNKTDKSDAKLIAEFAQSHRPAAWTPPPASFKDLQALVRRLENLLSARTKETNRLGSCLTTKEVIEDIQEHVAYLDKKISKIKKAIQDHIDKYPDLKKQRDLLTTIPGIGVLTAAKLLGEIRDVREFDSARQLAAYAGVTPKNFRSGSSVQKKARLSKAGNAHLRKALYMPAIVAKRRNPIVNEFCLRLEQAGLTPMQQIGAAMRKLLHLVFGILKSQQPFDPNYLRKTQVLT